MEDKSFKLLRGLALIALILSTITLGYLAWRHYQLVLGLAEGKSICNISQKLDCDAVNTSPWSEFLGIPLGLWGAVTNLTLAALLWWAPLSERKDAYLRYVLYGALFSALASVVMAGISALLLGNFCLFCIAAYVFSFIALGCTWKLAPKDKPFFADITALFSGGDKGFRGVLYTGLVAGVAVLFIDNVFMSTFAPQLKAAIEQSLAMWDRAKVNNFDTTDALIKGNQSPDAKMVIVEFADFLCPHCKHAAPQLHAFVNSHPDVRLVFLQFPLDGQCNPAVQAQRGSCIIAKGVFCSNKQGKGWEALDWAFENQGKVQEEQVKTLPQVLSLNDSDFKACLEASATHDAIVKQAQAGASAGLEGTPTVYVNGKMLPRGSMIKVLDAVYKRLNP